MLRWGIRHPITYLCLWVLVGGSVGAAASFALPFALSLAGLPHHNDLVFGLVLGACVGLSSSGGRLARYKSHTNEDLGGPR